MYMNDNGRLATMPDEIVRKITCMDWKHWVFSNLHEDVEVWKILDCRYGPRRLTLKDRTYLATDLLCTASLMGYPSIIRTDTVKLVKEAHCSWTLCDDSDASHRDLLALTKRALLELEHDWRRGA